MSRESVRFVALGDSASCGVGDPTPDGWRGWAQILAEAMAVDHDVAFRKLAIPGACASDVRREQLAPALDHRPLMASLVVGLNDALRSSWEPARLRDDLLHCAGELAAEGTILMTVRFHDHTRVLGLPGPLARPLRRRLDVLNEIYDEVHERYGVIRLDLAEHPDIYDRDMWAVDRIHPSEKGHRWLAFQAALLLRAEGLDFAPPSLVCTSDRMRPRELARILLLDMAPWLGRRAGEFGPWAAREAVRRGRGRLLAA
ncbi:SGNH/GDSL hydrolase family protein [Nocardioides ginsengisoli]|uniref:SGNH/GDSL hydrolase family protein n=1 Tax=Nocardioides ginsengisoli TaxID=363868 RepID=A0ABW3W6Z1_9ACTN